MVVGRGGGGVTTAGAGSPSRRTRAARSARRGAVTLALAQKRQAPPTSTAPSWGGSGESKGRRVGAKPPKRSRAPPKPHSPPSRGLGDRVWAVVRPHRRAAGGLPSCARVRRARVRAAGEAHQWKTFAPAVDNISHPSIFSAAGAAVRRRRRARAGRGGGGERRRRSRCEHTVRLHSNDGCSVRRWKTSSEKLRWIPSNSRRGNTYARQNGRRLD